MLIAGPCAIESKTQAFKIARFVKSCGATIFRGGAWKGQNKPFPNGKPAYWGLGDAATDILRDIQDELDIPVITEVQSITHADWCMAHRNFKYLQIGARHMQNFPLLKYIAANYNKFKLKGIVLKRGLGNTIDEWIGAAEHLGGPERVILCERGIVSFDRTPQTRWRLDFVGAAHIKEYTDYRIIIDPSHGSGDRRLVERLSLGAMAMGMDGLMIEVHHNPNSSPTDARQTIDFEEFQHIATQYKEFL